MINRPVRQKLCACGCGSSVSPGRSFKRGHHQAFFKRKHTEETKRKMSIDRKGKKPTEETKRKMSVAKKGKTYSRETIMKRSGSNHPNWRGGVSNDPYCPIFYDPEFRKMIFKKDKYTCCNPYCSGKSKNLVLHHIDSDKENCKISNIITLCISCNTKASWYRKKWKRFYSIIFRKRR